jgi:hypothetical protein
MRMTQCLCKARGRLEVEEMPESISNLNGKGKREGLPSTTGVPRLAKLVNSLPTTKVAANDFPCRYGMLSKVSEQQTPFWKLSSACHAAPQGACDSGLLGLRQAVAGSHYVLSNHSITVQITGATSTTEKNPAGKFPARPSLPVTFTVCGPSSLNGGTSPAHSPTEPFTKPNIHQETRRAEGN